MKKKYFITFTIVLLIHNIYSQKLEKIKGSKIVTLSEVILNSITSIELSKNINLVFKKGETDKLIISADDNLHEVLDINIDGSKLSLSLLKKIYSKKAFDITLYVANLTEIVLDDNSTLTNTEFYKTDSLHITLNNKSKLNSFIDADIIVYQGNDSSKSTSTYKAQSINYFLQDKAAVTNISTAEITKINTEGKADITLSGKSTTTYIKASQSTDVRTTNLISTNTEIIAEDKSSIYTNTKENLTITARDNSKVYIYGKAIIDLMEFKGESALYKKQ